MSSSNKNTFTANSPGFTTTMAVIGTLGNPPGMGNTANSVAYGVNTAPPSSKAYIAIEFQTIEDGEIYLVGQYKAYVKSEFDEEEYQDLKSTYFTTDYVQLISTKELLQKLIKGGLV